MDKLPKINVLDKLILQAFETCLRTLLVSHLNLSIMVHFKQMVGLDALQIEVHLRHCAQIDRLQSVTAPVSWVQHGRGTCKELLTSLIPLAAQR